MENGASTRLVIYTDLRMKCIAAKTVAAMSNVFRDGAAASATRSALAADSARIDRLSPSGDLGKSVNAGTLSHQRWTDIARTTWEDIQAQMKVMNQDMPSWKRVWDEIVVPSSTQIGEGIEDAVETTLAVSPYVYALVGLLVLLLITNNVRAIKGG